MALEQPIADPAFKRPALTVSALNRTVAGLLERSFPLVRVRGELGNLVRATSGHWYFALKDDHAQVRCVMFRARNQLLGWTPRDGDEVELSAIVSLYEARGEYQLGVEFMRRAGQGRLYEEFLRLKDRLAAEGLFAVTRKRALPAIPRRVAIVTSMEAAALCDVVTTLCRRAPYVGVRVYPVPVQGAGAGARIAAMLRQVSRRAASDAIDVVLLVRGGGSIEDLWSFNEEIVARAIVACPVPVVVGVGHESDVTIADFAADLRAPTPTAAAELVAPSTASLLGEVENRYARLKRMQVHRLHSAGQRVDYALRTLATPRMPLQALAGRLEALRLRLRAAARRAFESRSAAAVTSRARLLAWQPVRQRSVPSGKLAILASHSVRRVNTCSLRLASLAARLHAMDPRAVLERGYSIAIGPDGRAVTNCDRLSEGAALQVVFARGAVQARVDAVLPDDPRGAWAIESSPNRPSASPKNH